MSEETPRKLMISRGGEIHEECPDCRGECSPYQSAELLAMTADRDSWRDQCTAEASCVEEFRQQIAALTREKEARGYNVEEIIQLHHKWVSEDDLSHEEVQDKLREALRQGRAGDTICQTCKLPNPSWSIESSYWNLVVPEKVGILCLRCFAEQAASMGVTGSWRLVPDESTNSLILGSTPISRLLADKPAPPTPEK